MCLLTTWKNPRTANKNITVYKMMEKGKLNPPFNDFEYQLKKLYKTALKETDDTSSFDDYDDEARDDATRTNAKRKIISIGPGFHSSLTIKRFQKDSSNKYHYDIYKCVIPKGSLYYKGFTDLIVSNKIKILEKINWN